MKEQQTSKTIHLSIQGLCPSFQSTVKESSHPKDTRFLHTRCIRILTWDICKNCWCSFWHRRRLTCYCFWICLDHLLVLTHSDLQNSLRSWNQVRNRRNPKDIEAAVIISARCICITCEVYFSRHGWIFLMIELFNVEFEFGLRVVNFSIQSWRNKSTDSEFVRIIRKTFTISLWNEDLQKEEQSRLFGAAQCNTQCCEEVLPQLSALCIGPGLGRHEGVLGAVARVIEAARPVKTSLAIGVQNQLERT